MPEPAISVLMSVYNGEQFLASAIESILAQSLTDFEFLILDDGSSDGSWSILQDYAGRDDRIRLIRRENKGLIVSLNELIAAATAPLLARMDCDDISMPDRFARQVAFLEANPDYGVVGSQRFNIDEQGQQLPMAGPDYALDHQQFLSNIGKESLLCHSSVMMRRDLVRAVGGYHAAFRHCEDFDLWLRLSNLTKLCSMSEKLVCYRHSADQVSKRHLTEQQLGTAVALAAYHEREAGRPDPTEASHRIAAARSAGCVVRSSGHGKGSACLCHPASLLFQRSDADRWPEDDREIAATGRQQSGIVAHGYPTCIDGRSSARIPAVRDAFDE